MNPTHSAVALSHGEANQIKQGSMEDHVILVDRNNRELGYEGKMEAHRDGKLHRAFSVFVLDNRDRLLLQRRAFTKYHSGGLWTNTCCSHPRPNEAVTDAAHRRLMEEMGFDCPLREIFGFVYRAELDNGLIEYEFDHVLIGRYAGEPIPDREEVDDWKWVDLDWLQQDIDRNPCSYTYWLKACFERVAVLLRGT
nr:isopentenyl-diphosphate Delta-isomerase [Rhodoferax sp.]